jgi:putative hydrolase of the HAD superfamily
MVRFLEQARVRGLQIVAVSNADPMLERRLALKGIRELFDAVINSSRVHAAKPDPAIYLAALRVARRRAVSCLFSDDKEPNVRQAQAHGIPSSYMPRAERFRPGCRSSSVLCMARVRPRLDEWDRRARNRLFDKAFRRMLA